MERCVLGAYAVVVGGAVLEVVAVAVLLELFPLGSHGEYFAMMTLSGVTQRIIDYGGGWGA